MRKEQDHNEKLLDGISPNGNSPVIIEKKSEQPLSQEIDPHFEAQSRRAWQQSSSQIEASLAARMKTRLMAQIASAEAMNQTEAGATAEFRGSEIPIASAEPMSLARPVAERSMLSRRLLDRVAKIAVAASVLVATAVGGYWFAMSGLQSQTFEVATLKGQKSMVTLPDGSLVRLNSSSKVVYTSAFNRRNRKIEMQGEAYFEVAKNANLPFTVTADGMEVTALGTKFNVRAYAEDAAIVTTLVEGKVAVVAGRQEQVLLPNQQVRCTRGDRQLALSQVDDKTHLVPWINNELIYNGQNLQQIAIEMERMYDVRVVFRDEKIKQFCYTGIVLNTSLANVLELIMTTSPVNYRMNENTIEFSQKKPL